jgi:hypothetical protein
MNSPLSILTATEQGQVGLATTLHRNLPMAWMRFELMIFVLEARRSNQMSQQAILQIENAKFLYIENRLSILYFIDPTSTERVDLTIHCSLRVFCNKNKAKRPRIYCLSIIQSRQVV